MGFFVHMDCDQTPHPWLTLPPCACERPGKACGACSCVPWNVDSRKAGTSVRFIHYCITSAQDGAGARQRLRSERMKDCRWHHRGLDGWLNNPTSVIC